MKSIFRKSLFGFLVLPVLLLIPSTKPAQATVVCSGMPVPLMSIVVNGTTYANSASNRDASYSMSVVSGTSLPVTFSNSSTGATPYNISRTYPNGHTLTYTNNPGTLSYTTDPITTNTFFAIGVDRDCAEDPTVEGGGSVTVSVTVTTPPTTYALSVARAGAGTGTVTSSPSGINCGTDCAESYNSGISVTLTATPAGGSTFGGWSGACSGTGSCVVSMTQARSVTATFDATTPPSIPSCSPSNPTPAIGQSVTITASGGSGGVSPYYTWSTGSGGGACATGGTCTTSYTTAGSKTITVTRNGVSGTCSVSVPVSDTTPTGAFTSMTSCTATGWADDVDTTVPRPVRVYSDGNLVSTVTAGTSGCSGSVCTFSANLAGLVSTGVAHSITGTVQGDDGIWRALSNPMSITCPVTDVTCSGPTAGQTGTTYSFTATGGAAHTWSASSAAGTMTPSGTTGSGSSVSKSFSAAGTKTITFTRTDTGATGSCTIDITTTPPALAFNLQANNSEGPITIAYGALPTLSWSSAGADRADNLGSTPVDEAWNGVVPAIDLSGTAQVSPLVRTTYNGRGVRYTPVGSVSDSVIVRVQPECLPAGQTITTGGTATLTARGGNGTYAWTSTGGTPTSGTGSSYNVSYATAGTYNVGLVSDALTATACTVTVSDAPATTGTIVVNSNVATTWTLSGGSGKPQNETQDQTSETYSDMEPGSYTLSNVPDIVGYDAPTISPVSSQDLEAGGTITFTINYNEEGGGVTDGVDLKINDSNNPAPVANGSTVDLSWTSNNIVSDSCVASEGIAPWSGARGDSGSETSGILSDTTTFTITCESSGKAGGEVSDSVAIIVTDPQCSDGSDNDNDSFTDFAGSDPGCDDAQDNNEQDGNDDDSGGDVTECSDGFDNDGDGGIDFATDRGSNGDVNCSSLLDDSERGSPDIREI